MPTKTTYTLHEPTPTSSYKFRHTGIGGAGNITKTRQQAPPSSLLPQSSASSSSSSARQQQSSSSSLLRSVGRGGAGNMCRANEERAMFSFDEELEREARRAPPSPIYHVGRGGQANVADEKEELRRMSGSSGGSGGSGGSERKGSLEWVKGLARKS